MPGGWRPPDTLIKFSEKRYEIKEILVCMGGGAGSAPFLDPPLVNVSTRSSINPVPFAST